MSYLYFIAVAVALFAASVLTDCDFSLQILPYSTNEKAFTNKVIWITGASSGIGASLAEELTAGGAQVVISARRISQLVEVADKCSLLGLRPFIVPFDALDFDEHKNAFQKVVQEFGRVDVLVLNAGRAQRSLAMEASVSDTKDLFELNVFSYINLAKIVVPTMTSRETGGQVVVLSSLAGKLGTPISSSYSATKFALHGYFDALRGEVNYKNVNIQMVCPGPVKSEITMHALGTAEKGHVGEKKMPTSRCTHLMAKGMKWRLDEIWISDNPFLAVTYLHTYFPFISRQLFKYIIGPGRVKTFLAGGDIYNMKNLFGGGK